MNKKYMNFLNDYENIKYIFLTAVVFFMLGGFLFYRYDALKNENFSLKTKNEMLVSWDKSEKINNHEEFFQELFQEDENIIEELEKIGINVKEMHQENAEENEEKIIIDASGNYQQIIDAFDIIRKSKNLKVPTLKKAKRNGTQVEFKLEIRVLK